MKKVIFYIAIVFAFTSCISTHYLYTPIVQLDGNLQDYKYVYVMPTSPVISSSGIFMGMSLSQHIAKSNIIGAPIKTVAPSEIISGYMMKKGYTPLPSPSDDLANETLLVSYGYIGRRSMRFSYASRIIIQMIDAKTHQLVASCEAEGCGNDETDDILQAIQDGLNAIFKDEVQSEVQSEVQPKVDTYFIFD